MMAPCKPTWNSTVEPGGRYFFQSCLPLMTTPDQELGVVGLIADDQLDRLALLAEIDVACPALGAMQA